MSELRIEEREHGICAVTFLAMASPCEILLDTRDVQAAREAGEAGAREAWRVERKFSRYRDDSVVAAIGRSHGQPIRVDDETAALLDFAAECHRLSDGAFDITSGILRRAWTFDGSDRVPSQAQIDALLPNIGFHRLRWQRPVLTMPENMELDFGGIGKEYAVDRALEIVCACIDCPVLVNFGGDLRANRASEHGPWRVGVERPDTDRDVRLMLELSCGALATSGDTRRFVLRDGVRYGHILDPKTGWPVRNGPRSITVAAPTCVHAGMLASLSMLKGDGAESFLRGEGVQFWALQPADTAPLSERVALSRERQLRDHHSDTGRPARLP